MEPDFTYNDEAPRMDHETAMQIQAATRYLMGELSDEEVLAFEEHYFECAQCTAELQADQAFAANLKAVFADRASRPNPVRHLVDWFERAAADWAVPLAS